MEPIKQTDELKKQNVEPTRTGHSNFQDNELAWTGHSNVWDNEPSSPWPKKLRTKYDGFQIPDHKLFYYAEPSSLIFNNFEDNTWFVEPLK